MLICVCSKVKEMSPFSPPFSKVIHFIKFNMRSNESSEFSVLSHSDAIYVYTGLCFLFGGVKH